MTVREDRSDLKRALVRRTGVGSLYIIEYCSLWDEDGHPEGIHIISAGYLASSLNDAREVLRREGQTLEPSPALFDFIDAFTLQEGGSTVATLQREDAAGWLTYPVGVR